MQQLSRIVVRNSAFGMAAQMLIKLLSFVFTVLIVRNLGADDFGQYSAVLAFGAMFVFIADLGLSPYMVREVARWRDAPDGAVHIRNLYANVLILRFLLSILAATLLIITAWLTGRPLVMIGAIALGTLGLLMYSVQGTCEALLSGHERLDINATARVLQQLAFVLVGGVVLWLGLGYYGLIGANLLGIALITFICWRGVRALNLHPGQITMQNWPTLLRASLPFGVIGLTLGLSYKFDTVMLNIYRGDSETGLYNAAYGLVFSMVMLSNVVNTALYPSLTRHAANAPETMPRVYERALRYLLMLALPIAVGGAALSGQIVPFLFGNEYLAAVPILAIVIWTVPLMFLSEFLGYVVVISGHESRVARSIMISTSLNIALNALLIPRYGFYAAAIMTVITEMVLVGQYVWLLHSLLRQIDWMLVLLRPLLAALLMGGVVLAAASLPLLLTILLGGMIYVGLLFAFGLLGRDEAEFVRGMLRRNPRLSHL